MAPFHSSSSNLGEKNPYSCVVFVFFTLIEIIEELRQVDRVQTQSHQANLAEKRSSKGTVRSCGQKTKA